MKPYPRSPHFALIHTNSGVHLRIDGANGEPIMTSEVYTDLYTANRAAHLVVRTVAQLLQNNNLLVFGADLDRLAANIEYRDERTHAE